jgi:hypothetical protein
MNKETMAPPATIKDVAPFALGLLAWPDGLAVSQTLAQASMFQSFDSAPFTVEDAALTIVGISDVNVSAEAVVARGTRSAQMRAAAAAFRRRE